MGRYIIGKRLVKINSWNNIITVDIHDFLRNSLKKEIGAY